MRWALMLRGERKRLSGSSSGAAHLVFCAAGMTTMRCFAVKFRIPVFKETIMRTGSMLCALLLLGVASLSHAAMRTKTIDYSVHGKAMRGVLVWDDAVKTPRPGVLMIPDWYGIGANSIALARTIAGRDYVVFMGDMYGKDLRPKSDQEAQAAVKPLYADRQASTRRNWPRSDSVSAVPRCWILRAAARTSPRWSASMADWRPTIRTWRRTSRPACWQ